MAVEGIQNNVTCIDWSIADKINHRRQAWETDFKKNYTIVADKIAESFTKEIFAKIGERLSDQYRPLPTRGNFFCRLNLNDAELKTLAQDTAQLAPFNEWFTKFSAAQQEIYKPNQTTLLKCFPDNQEIDYSYFESKMEEVGQLVEKKVRENFAAFAQNPKNAAFKYEITWYPLDKSSIPLCRPKNLLTINIWIAT